MDSGASQPIPFAEPLFGPEEDLAFREVLRSGQVNEGPQVRRFEERLEEGLGVRHVRVVNSGYAAALLSLRTLGVGPGDPVEVPAFGRGEIALAATALDAAVRFTDVDPGRLGHGWPGLTVARDPDTGVVALAQPVDFGARGAACIDFDPRSIICTGEGGAVCTNDDEFAAKIDAQREVLAGIDLPEPQAAVGIAQMDRLPAMLAEREMIAGRYVAGLAEVPGLRLPEAGTGAWQAVVCRFSPAGDEELLGDPYVLERAAESLDRIVGAIQSQNIETGEAGELLVGNPLFGDDGLSDEERWERFPHAHLTALLGFALPLFPGMMPQQANRVMRALTDAAAMEAGG